MGLMTGIKANKAYRLQQKGETAEAIRLYEEAFAEGLDDPRYNLAYALLILRKGEYRKTKEFLVKHQKAPGMTTEQRITLLVDYAVCCYRLGDTEKGIRTLEQQFRKTETGLLYQTLGYLYVEKYDREHEPDWDAAEAAQPAEAERETEAAQPAGAAEAAEDGEAAPSPTPREDWETGRAEAEAFIRKSVEYDDEDPICLDNLGQFLLRALGRKEEARGWFEKALAVKDSQIDTLYFLSRYDEEAGNIDAALRKLEKAVEGRFSPLNYCTKERVEQEIARLKGAH